jgi:NAD(P)-dependent dehydrogenase (short-subunit alcohol dehydrogenase family)
MERIVWICTGEQTLCKQTTGRIAWIGHQIGMVSYLASPEAAFVTGASLKIDGGITA